MHETEPTKQATPPAYPAPAHAPAQAAATISTGTSNTSSRASQQHQQHQQRQHKAATEPKREYIEYKHDSKNATKNLVQGLKITKILFVVNCINLGFVIPSEHGHSLQLSRKRYDLTSIYV